MIMVGSDHIVISMGSHEEAHIEPTNLNIPYFIFLNKECA